MVSSHESSYVPPDLRSFEENGDLLPLDEPIDVNDELAAQREKHLEELAETEYDVSALDLQEAIEEHDASIKGEHALPIEVIDILIETAQLEAGYRAKGYRQDRIDYLISRYLYPQLLKLRNQGIDASNAIASAQPKPASVTRLHVHNDTDPRDPDWRERQMKDS